MQIEKYSVGDCEMIKSENGKYVHIENVLDFLEWLIEVDKADVMLEKITTIQAQIKG